MKCVYRRIWNIDTTEVFYISYLPQYRRQSFSQIHANFKTVLGFQT